MLTVYDCLMNQHDLMLVGLAVLVCAIASFTAVNLLHYVRKSTGRRRQIWLAVCAVASGFGIWATHFIAMLAFSPAMMSGYDVSLTLLSLLAAIALTGAGLAVALAPGLPAAASLGGAVVGGGIAAMHYTGMAAFEVEGRLAWDRVLVALSIVLGLGIGAASLPVGLRRGSLGWRIAGALLLTLAICSHHFTAMGAASIIPDPTITVPQSALSRSWLALAVAFASFEIVLLAFAGLAVDVRERRRAKLEASRMRDLANAAVEGLVVCEGHLIRTANNSFAALADCGIDKLVRTPLETYFRDADSVAKLFEDPSEAVEAELRRADGSVLPVELIMRPVNFAGRPHNAIAVRDLRARKKAEQHIRFLAHHDALTGLPNRSSFANKLDYEIDIALTNGQQLAVFCLDLDRFKEINDLFGHATGDRALQTVAACVADVLDPSQMLARLGGDEFAIVASDIAGPAAAGRLAENILQALRAKVDGPAEVLLCTSIGIAIYPHDGTDRETLLNHADTALYRAKAEGHGTYRFFEAAMGIEVRDRRLLEHDLRRAVPRGEMRLLYQPQIDIQRGKVIGFEALLRWRHPNNPTISPAVFIPIAEESGAILDIGEWALRTACLEAATWTRPLNIAVNVSAVQLHSPSFPQLIHTILLQTGLPARRLEIEVTETALIRDLNRALTTLRQLKAMGVRIAMDDFGTGYSSLSNLRAFPFDKIKIDASFIKAVDVNEQTATIVRAVLGLGRSLGLPVLAEGVETAAELKFLIEARCDEAQGYHLGKPAPIEHFRELTHGQGPVPVEERLRVAHAGPERRRFAAGA